MSQPTTPTVARRHSDAWKQRLIGAGAVDLLKGPPLEQWATLEPAAFCAGTKSFLRNSPNGLSYF